VHAAILIINFIIMQNHELH